MNWTDRLLDLLEAKRSLPPTDRLAAAKARVAQNRKESNRATNRAYGTTLKSLRTPSGESSAERRGAERQALGNVRSITGKPLKPDPEDAQVISGARPSKRQPEELKALRAKKRAERDIFQSNVETAADERAVRAQSPDKGTTADTRAMSALKDRLRAKFKPSGKK